MSGPVSSHRDAICCPDCGTALVFRDLTNGTSVCECPSETCRAAWISGGQTQDRAADKFIRRCEEYGYTLCLVERIKSIARTLSP